MKLIVMMSWCVIFKSSAMCVICKLLLLITLQMAQLRPKTKVPRCPCCNMRPDEGILGTNLPHPSEANPQRQRPLVSSWCCNPHSPSVSLSSCFVPLLSLIRLQSQLLQLLCTTSVFDTTAIPAVTAALYHFCLWYDCNPSCCSCFVPLLSLIRLQPQLLQLLCTTSVFDTTAISAQLLQLLCITSVFDTAATSAATASLYHFCLWYDCDLSQCSGTYRIWQ